MKRILIVSTPADNSLPLLVEAVENLGLECSCIFYEDEIKQIPASDIVYFRDPFNTGSYDELEIEQLVAVVAGGQQKARFVDGVQDMEGILFEDKWRQYEVLQEFMPETALLYNNDQFVAGTSIIKKRISARARDIHFEVTDELFDGNYLIQLLLKVAEEWRVYVVAGEIITKVAIRTPKTPGSKVKVASVVEILPEVQTFAERVATYLPQLDFYGLDIIKTTEGKLYVLEVNRSCQFLKFNTISGQNLAEMLFQKLSGKA